jgi:hypothetical protein
MSLIGDIFSIFDEVSCVLQDVEKGVPLLADAKPRSELDYFAKYDPLLSDLMKEHKDACGYRAMSAKQYGKADGMTDMAAIAEDSAWCAVQTRYLELRGDRALMKAVQSEMAADQAAEQKTLKDAAQNKLLQQYRLMQMAGTLRKDSKIESGFEWLLLLLSFMDGVAFFRSGPSYRFNAMAA